MNERIRRTIFSQDRVYRYLLWREWDNPDARTGYAMFIGLNPSTADETNDDPTIRKCIGLSKRWGYNGLCMANLFAFRATKPSDMKKSRDPIGPANNLWLCEAALGAGTIIAAWGNHGSFLHRGLKVSRMFENLKSLRRNKDGSPEHPLYVPYEIEPTPYP